MKKSKKLEDLFPIYKVEHDCILSKQGDITVGFEITLPEIFTLSTGDFEALHQAWLKAIRVLPAHSILHKQDWFVEAAYQAEFLPDQTMLRRSSERYFHERPYLDHHCYLFLTKKPEGRKQATSLFSNLIRPTVVPVQTINQAVAEQFLDKTGQFAKILQDSGYVQLRRLTDDDFVSNDQQPGLLERYCYLLTGQDQPVIRDIVLKDSLKVGDQYCQLFTLADVEDLPTLCGPRVSYDKYSTDKTKFSVGFAAPLGQLLSCSHIYNQYLCIEDAALVLKKMESRRRRLQSLSAYSRENTISRDATNQFLNEAIAEQRLPIKAHFNVLVWAPQKDQLKDIRNTVSAALAQMDARTKQETAGAPQLFWAGLPGNAADLPQNETFDTFAEQATCFLNMETNYRSSVSPVGIRLGERISGLPVHVDISDEPISRGICTNRNKFVLGPSGGYRAIYA